MFGSLFGTKSNAPAVPGASTASAAAPIVPEAGVILRVTNTDSSATIDIQFTLDKDNKLTNIKNGKFQIATSDGTKTINDLNFTQIEIQNGKLSIEAPIVMSGPSFGPPPPGYNAANPVKGGSKRRRAYRPRKSTRRNRITR